MEDLLNAEKGGGGGNGAVKRDPGEKGGSFRSAGSGSASGRSSSLIGFFVGGGSSNNGEIEEDADSDSLSPTDVLSPTSSSRFLQVGNGAGAAGAGPDYYKNLRFSESTTVGIGLTNNVTTTRAATKSNKRPPPRASSNLDKFDVVADILSASERNMSVPEDVKGSRRDMMMATTSIPKRRSKEDLALAAANAKISRVENSWYAISSKIGEVGLKFFLQMFDEHPELIQLFPFGDDSIDQNVSFFCSSLDSIFCFVVFCLPLLFIIYA